MIGFTFRGLTAVIDEDKGEWRSDEPLLAKALNLSYPPRQQASDPIRYISTVVRAAEAFGGTVFRPRTVEVELEPGEPPPVY
jgi:hypothetical protein